eukprot:CAMPEP_0119567454 /NCGR_PEP_ID=MMETSP1352-20130426/35963_1 /TAXON_ID=265584 /ORGANISM="Stauroneis constricta, Strain CCMP1120" /LENGTH=94 /DNA_ID=CAMNT_0007616717 /DNA_START=422 /DNA_END=703 /DNA_ORIENTATION=+
MASPCGNVTDSCMNQENWDACQALVQGGCQMIATLESCPLQFMCGDNPYLSDSAENTLDEASVSATATTTSTNQKALLDAGNGHPDQNVDDLEV